MKFRSWEKDPRAFWFSRAHNFILWLRTQLSGGKHNVRTGFLTRHFIPLSFVEMVGLLVGLSPSSPANKSREKKENFMETTIHFSVNVPRKPWSHKKHLGAGYI